MAELSGGMDSGLTALATAATLGSGVMSIGAQFRGDMGRAQRARRTLLVDRGGFDDVVIPAERYPPFSPESGSAGRYGIWPEDENYPDLSEAMFGVLQVSGIDTLISGIGGDELYTIYAHEEEPPVSFGETACPLLEQGAMERMMRQRTAYPRGWLQETSWRGAGARAQRLLRRGLWPVYPYNNIALARFLSLPSP